MDKDTSIIVVVDTREQYPYKFDRYACNTVSSGLPVGDYSIPGMEDQVALERKKLDDLIGCLLGGRERFERELQKGQRYDLFAVVVEASLDDVKQGRYRSEMKPHAALQSLLAWRVRYGIDFIFAGSREGGEYVTYSLLRRYLVDAESRFKAAMQAIAVWKG